jgi:hypothetical protein
MRYRGRGCQRFFSPKMGLPQVKNGDVFDPVVFPCGPVYRKLIEKVHLFERTWCAPAQGTPRRTARYLWVPTAQQRPDLQADGVPRYATRAGLDMVAEHMDMAVSGRQEGRPQVRALRRAARHHAFAYVLVRKCDHLARSVSH